MPAPAAASFSDLGASTTTTSAVVNNEATPLASCKADRTTYKKNAVFYINIYIYIHTLVGSIIPALTISTNSSRCAS
jgi:hypothetical protein